MDLRVLGPIEVVDGDVAVPLGGPRQRLVLALLTLNAGETVSTDRLIDGVWGDDPPDAARRTVQAYVSNLRKELEAAQPETLIARSPGYVLTVDPSSIDARHFEDAVVEGRTILEANPSVAAATLRDALALWRGAPYADLAGAMALRPEITRLEELRRNAVELRIEADLALGLHGQLIGELETLVAEHPLSERFTAQLMLALYRAGRQADALRAYQRTRTTLGEELGIEPSTELSDLEQSILDHSEDLTIGVAEQPSPSSRARSDIIRGFETRRHIGESHFADTYVAYQRSLEREVAVSVLKPRYANDAAFIRSLEAEVSKTIRVTHPNIAPFYDFWHEPGGAYFVRRYFPEGSLGDAIGSGSWEPANTTRLIAQVGSALEACHRRGVFHCDLKPSNIMLDEEGNGYVTHFAVPRSVFADDATYVAHASTSGGATPEDIRLLEPIPQIDVCGLATIARRLDLIGQVTSSPSLEAVLDRAMATDSADRYPSIGEFVEAYLAAAGDGARAPQPISHNPYKGLRAFTEADRSDFFGRAELVSSLVVQLADPVPGCLALVGASGIGKSSILNAGLIPALRDGATNGSERWRIVKMHPGVHPYGELAGALRQVMVDTDPQALGHLTWGDIGVGEAIISVLDDPSAEVLLVIDQFEELFTLVGEQSVREAFIESLIDAVEDPNVHLRLIIALRADFYDRPLRYPRLAGLLTGCMATVVPMSAAELTEAITEPAERAGAVLDPGLADRIADDVQRQPGMLPLAQYAMTDLFEHRDGNRITAAAYERLGGVAGPLGTRPEEIYLDLDREAQAATRHVFLHLVAVGEDGKAVRRRVQQSELTSIVGFEHSARNIIDAFGEARLLSFDQHPVTRSPTVEIAHDALVREWDRLRGWIDDHLSDVRLHQRLTDAMSDWTSSDRDPEFLLAGGLLHRLAGWSKATDMALSDAEHSYLAASITASAAEEREEAERIEYERELEDRSRRRLRLLAVVWTLTALVAVLAIFAFAQWQRSENLAERAEVNAAADQLASISDVQRAHDPELALLLALRAVETTIDADAPVTPLSEAALVLAMRTLGFPPPPGPASGDINVARGLPIGEIIILARSNLTRGFTQHECSLYLGLILCPIDTIASPLDA